ncbi:hypothetical protein JHW43_009505 [Diplocarpon mali]|nr:hypothetical protein JHW43_009505 [Diplocarpon mali]
MDAPGIPTREYTPRRQRNAALCSESAWHCSTDADPRRCRQDRVPGAGDTARKLSPSPSLQLPPLRLATGRGWKVPDVLTAGSAPRHGVYLALVFRANLLWLHPRLLPASP